MTSRGATEAHLPLALLRRVEDALLRAEEVLRLVESLTPSNYSSELARLSSESADDSLAHPNLEFLPRSVLDLRVREAQNEVDSALFHLSTPDSSGDELGVAEAPGTLVQLLRERAAEILLECEMVAACGRSEIGSIAARRYTFKADEIEAARRVAREWLEEDVEAEQPGHSRTGSLAGGLVSRARRREAEWGVSIRVVERPLSSVAAIGTDAVYVPPGSQADEGEIDRIFAHEVEGHLLPRLLARGKAPPFRIGTAGSAQDEEGRAILLEERSGQLSGARKLELSVRFLLGRAAQESAESARKVAEEILSRGIPRSLVVRALLRSLRGGGWGREMIYLPGYLRVRSALQGAPHLEDWMRRGRISIHGARVLSAMCDELPSSAE